MKMPSYLYDEPIIHLDRDTYSRWVGGFQKLRSFDPSPRDLSERDSRMAVLDQNGDL
jgi:hypothetical protein